VPNASVQRTSNFSYAGNYVYASFSVASDAPPGSLAVLVKSGNDMAALTGALRIAATDRGRVVRR
jgi:hypothetical protein